MNEQEIKELVERLRISSVKGKYEKYDPCNLAADVIEQLQAELRAKDERIAILEAEIRVIYKLKDEIQ